MKNFVEELRWRGMIQDIMPGTEEKLMEGSTAAYVGIDPTADSLHIGHMVSIMILKHFQNCGHKPIALVGGATGMIGDPSMKSQERNLLDEATLNHNVACIKAQLSKFLDFDSDASNKAELVNNYDWMKNFTFLDFAREIGKHITVNYMMAKDSVKKRLSGEARDGMSFTEFTYQLLQGYDFLYLYEHKGCTLQMVEQTSGATSPQVRSLSAASSARKHSHSPALLSQRLTEESSERLRRVTSGSILSAHHHISSTSSGLTYLTQMLTSTSRSSQCLQRKRSTLPSLLTLRHRSVANSRSSLPRKLPQWFTVHRSMRMP